MALLSVLLQVEPKERDGAGSYGDATVSLPGRLSRGAAPIQTSDSHACCKTASSAPLCCLGCFVGCPLSHSAGLKSCQAYPGSMRGHLVMHHYHWGDGGGGGATRLYWMVHAWKQQTSVGAD